MNTSQYPLVVDVSKVNDDSLEFFQDLAAKGVKAVIIQLTAGTYLLNPKAPNQVTNARLAGLRTHAYHYSYENGYDEILEATKLFKQRCVDLNFDSQQDFFFIDEEEAKYNPEDSTDDVNSFIDLMINYKNVGVYSGAFNFLGKGKIFINPNQLHTNILWVANYGTNQPGVDNTDIWQFNTNFGGYNLDINFDFNGILCNGTNPQPQQPSGVQLKVGHGTIVYGETATSIANALNNNYNLGLTNPLATFVANNPEIFHGDANATIYPGQIYVFYY